MPVKVDLIPDEHFLSLSALYVEMNKRLSVPVPAAAALYMLTHDLANSRSFMAMGLYEEGVLSGFVTGYALSESTYHFSGIFVVNKNKNVKLLIDKCNKHIKDLGFTSWEANCNNDNIASILTKYGAKPIYTRLKKGI